MEAATSTAPLPLQALASQVFDGELAVSVEKAAKALSCSRKHIYWLLNSGQLDCVRIGFGKKAGKRVAVLSLLEFIANGGTGKADEAPTPAERLAASRSRRGPAGKYL